MARTLAWAAHAAFDWSAVERAREELQAIFDQAPSKGLALTTSAIQRLSISVDFTDPNLQPVDVHRIGATSIRRLPKRSQ